MKPTENAVLLLLLLFFGSIDSRGQPLPAKANRFTTQDGLPHNTITSLCQDKTGFIWVATVNGLCRYDGLDFSPVQIPSSGSNHWSQVVEAMYVDSREIMWFGTRTGGIISWDQEREEWICHTASIHRNDYIQHFYQGKTDRVWFLSHNGRLGYYNRMHGALKWVAELGNNAEYLYQDARKRLWVLGQAYIKVFDADSPNFKELPGPAALNEITGDHYLASVNSEGEALFKSKDSYAIYSIEKNSVQYFKQDAKEMYATTNNPNHEFLWLSYKQINTLDRNNLTYHSYAITGFGDHRVYNLLKDQTGLIWAATDIGLFKIDRKKQRFKTYSTEEGSVRLDHNYIRALSVAENHIWLGFKQAPVLRLSYLAGERKIREKQLYGLKDQEGNIMDNPTINSILVTRSGKVWCGGFEGLYKLKEKEQEFEKQLINTADTSFFPGEVWALQEGPEGQILAGGRTIGLWVISDDHEPYRVSFGKGEEVSVWCIYKDDKATIHVGTSAGLFQVNKVSGGKWVAVLEKAFEGHNIWDIESDGKGTYFIASTDWGFSVFKDGKVIRHYTSREGLPSSSVCGVELDSQGNAWLSTVNGLCCLDLSTGKITNYYEEDGLAGNDFNFSVCDKGPEGE
ncbi:MAG: two-component regulator propeller domain-containing protein, partial [Owenweeksia sp.]